MPNYVLESLKSKHKRVTTAMLMDASGVPREDWQAEMISGLPRQMRRHAEKLAEFSQLPTFFRFFALIFIVKPRVFIIAF